jgi:hypothetical protein
MTEKAFGVLKIEFIGDEIVYVVDYIGVPDGI